MHTYCRYHLSMSQSKQKVIKNRVNEHIQLPVINPVEGLLGKRGDAILHDRTTAPGIKTAQNQILKNSTKEKN